MWGALEPHMHPSNLTTGHDTIIPLAKVQDDPVNSKCPWRQR